MMVIVKRDWSVADRAKASEAKGRKTGKPHGSHIADLAELKKAILLCDSCMPRFNARNYGYHRQTIVCGKCDACKSQTDRAVLFMHESLVKHCLALRDASERGRRRI